MQVWPVQRRPAHFRNRDELDTNPALLTFCTMQPDDVINLVSSDEEPNANPSTKRRRVFFPQPESPSSGSDIEFVSQSKRDGETQDLSQLPESTPQTTAADAELTVVGSRDALRALVDYPHFRFQCAIEPFKRQRANRKEKFCPRCFCYVCDIPASECSSWRVHCKAVDSTHKWRSDREATLEERRRRHEALPSERRTIPSRHTRPSPIRTRLSDDHSIPSSVEEVPMGDAPEVGSEEMEEDNREPFEEAMRALNACELEPDMFTMRPLACALDDAAEEGRPRVPLGTMMRNANRRAGARQAGAR